MTLTRENSEPDVLLSGAHHDRRPLRKVAHRSKARVLRLRCRRYVRAAFQAAQSSVQRVGFRDMRSREHRRAGRSRAPGRIGSLSACGRVGWDQRGRARVLSPTSRGGAHETDRARGEREARPPARVVSELHVSRS
jgi:hypothetical protein